MAKKASSQIQIKEREETTSIQGNIGEQLVLLRSEVARVSAIAETIYARLAPILNDGAEEVRREDDEDISHPHPNCQISDEIFSNIEKLGATAETLGAILDRLEI